MFVLLSLLSFGFNLVASQPSPFSYCNGNVAYCLTAQVILQCTLCTNGSSFRQPGTCYDILNNPFSGALCAESGPSAGDATYFSTASRQYSLHHPAEQFTNLKL